MGKTSLKITRYFNRGKRGNDIAKNIRRNPLVKILSGELSISHLSLVYPRLIIVQDGDKLGVSTPMNLK